MPLLDEVINQFTVILSRDGLLRQRPLIDESV